MHFLESERLLNKLLQIQVNHADAPLINEM